MAGDFRRVVLRVPFRLRGLRIDGSGHGRVAAGPAPRDASLEIRGSGGASFRGARVSGSGDVRRR